MLTVNMNLSKMRLTIMLALFAVSCSANPKDGKVTLAAVGDVLFARSVGKQIAKHGAN